MDALIRALPKVLSAAGDNDEVAEAAARIAWSRVAGEPLCQHAVPFRLYHRTLIIAVSDAIWQKQMSALSGQLLSRLNSMLGQGTITFIEFRIDPKTVAIERAAHLPLAPVETTESILASVPEDLIAAANLIQDESLRRRFLLAAGASIRRRETPTIPGRSEI
jgi:hypothetical protein